MDDMTPDAVALLRPAGGFPPAVGRRPRAGTRRAILTEAIQLQVIPQLVQRTNRDRSLPLARHVERLAALSMAASGQAVIDVAQDLLDSGFEAEAIYLDLLTPTAQLLGQYWADDLCTFADVTIGVGHLRTAMRVLEAAFLRDGQPVGVDAPRALLLPLPGEQHDYGAAMLASFFRRAGWCVWPGPVRSSTELAETVGRDWIDLVGFSVSNEAAIESTQAEITAVRQASRNKSLVVMVGGLPFAADPSLAVAVGADGTAADGAKAVDVASALVRPRPPP